MNQVATGVQPERWTLCPIGIMTTEAALEGIQELRADVVIGGRGSQLWNGVILGRRVQASVSRCDLSRCQNPGLIGSRGHRKGTACCARSRVRGSGAEQLRRDIG